MAGIEWRFDSLFLRGSRRCQEPSFACHSDEPDHFLDVIAGTVVGVDAHVSMHICFWSYRARAVGGSSRCFPTAGGVGVNQLAFEFANRKLAETELLGELPERLDSTVGLVDVKNTWIEPAELVAQRLRTVLQ